MQKKIIVLALIFLFAGGFVIAQTKDANISFDNDVHDFGKINEAAGSINSDEFRSSIGAGIRYITPIGPIGIVYGYKLNPEEDESIGRWHFAIGYSF